VDAARRSQTGPQLRPAFGNNRAMIFEQVATGGCQSYLVGCAETCAGALIDPEVSQIDRYHALAAREGLRIRFVIDTHTHADHFSAARRIADKLGALTVMHRASPTPGVAMRVDDGESIVLGKLRLQVLHTPGHTADSMCLVGADRVFTGDTLLIGGTGRTDLPTGDPEALYDSLFGRLLHLDPALLVYPAHDYKGRAHSTIGAEIESNPRLQQRERAAFVQMMKSLDLSMPTHLTEALRTNMSGGKTVAEMLAEATACVPFMSMAELRTRVESPACNLVVLDVREKDQYEAGHIPGARLLPRGQLELRVDKELPDPTARIVTCCEFGRISTLAAATLRTMGFQRTVALDGGMKSWLEAGYPVRVGATP
jgi:glyoxylase-like metal-dependent hydrolase (beta-lactamase superfamily II)/rhodanese-related sulfurtransferase